MLTVQLWHTLATVTLILAVFAGGQTWLLHRGHQPFVMIWHRRRRLPIGQFVIWRTCSLCGRCGTPTTRELGLGVRSPIPIGGQPLEASSLRHRPVPRCDALSFAFCFPIPPAAPGADDWG
jgi:hypothetical protein